MQTARDQKWVPVGATIAASSGVWGALQLMWGNFAIGCGFLIVSIAALRWPVSVWDCEPPTELAARQRWVALLSVCALAAFFRTYRLNPPGLWGDDAINGLLAFDVLDGKISSPFQLVEHSHSHFHALTNYAIAAVFRAFGPDLATLRLPGIMAGTLAVPLLYATVAPLFGARVALVAVVFFASSPLQISHAKALTQLVFGEFFQLLGLCLLVRGVTGSRHWLIVAAAIPTAMCLYTYHSAKVAPLVAVIYLIAVLCTAPPPRRRLAWLCAAAIAVLLLCLIPAVISYGRLPVGLTARVGGTAVWPLLRESGSLWPLWDSVWRTLMIFHYEQGPRYHWFGLAFDPALNAIVAFLLVHGLVASVRNWREPRHILLLTWVIVGLVPGFLSTDAPRVYRAFLASPPMYVWAALPVAYMLQFAVSPGVWWLWLRGLAVILILSVPLVDFNYYFYRVYSHPLFHWFQGERIVEMARTLRSFGPGWTGYVLANDFTARHETLLFLSRAWGLTLGDVASLSDVLPVRDVPQGGVLFMMARGSLGAASAMHAMYPASKPFFRSEVKPRSWWFDSWFPLATHPRPSEPTLAFLPVSHRVAQESHGLTATYVSADGEPLSVRVDRELSLTELPLLGSGPTPPAQVHWSGALDAPAHGPYQIVLQSNIPACLWIDGAEVASHDDAEGERYLARGLHHLRAVAAIAPDPFVGLRWQPPGEKLGPVPAERLFRLSPYGLLAEYRSGNRLLQRIEPFPYYSFFPPTFPEPFSVLWRASLRVPAPGGHRLAPESNGQRSLWVDGRSIDPSDRLGAGEHDFEMQITDVPQRARLKMYWQRPDGKLEPIPPEAFRPPQATGLEGRVEVKPP